MIPIFLPKPVLEVGPGHKPYPQSDCFVDLYLDNRERGGNIPHDGRPLIIANVEDLPFRDKVFGFSICSHVLEHVVDPVRAGEELSRVSKAGYVETPSPLLETLQAGREYHRWIVTKYGGGLLFRPKTRSRRSSLLFTKLGSKNLLFRAFLLANIDMVVTRLLWKDRLKIFVDHTSNFDWDEYENLAQQGLFGSLKNASSRIVDYMLRRYGGILKWNISFSFKIEDVLGCTICKKTVVVDEKRVFCLNCKGYFPREKNIYYMTRDSFVRLI